MVHKRMKTNFHVITLPNFYRLSPQVATWPQSYERLYSQAYKYKLVNTGVVSTALKTLTESDYVC